MLTACSTKVGMFKGPYQPVTALPEQRFLDMHCHGAGIGAGGSGCFISEALQKNFRFHFYLRSLGVTRKELEAEGDGMVFRKISEQIAQSQSVGSAIVLAMDGVVNDQGELDRERTELYVPNEFVAAETAKYTNLLFGASVNPYRKDALERLEWAKAHGARLIKWLPNTQLIDPADERLAPFYRKLVELHLPLLCHTGRERSFTHSNDELGDPERLRLPLKLGVTVIAAHIASTGKAQGENCTKRLLRLMPEYPNLYADISALNLLNKVGYLRIALTRPEFRGRLLYGTDYPLINTPVVSAWFFPLNLTIKQMWQISRIKNPWDRDVAMKQALGVPTELWEKADEVLKTGKGEGRRPME